LKLHGLLAQASAHTLLRPQLLLVPSQLAPGGSASRRGRAMSGAAGSSSPQACLEQATEAPLAAVAQMTATADTEQNFQTCRRLAEVCTALFTLIHSLNCAPHCCALPSLPRWHPVVPPRGTKRRAPHTLKGVAHPAALRQEAARRKCAMLFLPECCAFIGLNREEVRRRAPARPQLPAWRLQASPSLPPCASQPGLPGPCAPRSPGEVRLQRRPRQCPGRLLGHASDSSRAPTQGACAAADPGGRAAAGRPAHGALPRPGARAGPLDLAGRLPGARPGPRAHAQHARRAGRLRRDRRRVPQGAGAFPPA